MWKCTDRSSPSGFTIWGQAILGNTPCASLLSTSYPLPSSVLESLTSSVAASATLSSGTAVPAEATQSITVIVNTVSPASSSFSTRSHHIVSLRLFLLLTVSLPHVGLCPRTSVRR